jgi:hypothetical protein
MDQGAGAWIPLYGRWSSPDGVHVSITAALTIRKGAIGRCKAFAKQPEHDIWLPEFWDGGQYDPGRHRANPFTPLVWAPETHTLGIDMGDQIAAAGPADRPQLGVDLTENLGLLNEKYSGDWHTADGHLALKSQVWGRWAPDPDRSRSRHREDGKILWASPEWLATTLANLKSRLVFVVTLRKYKSSRDYDSASGVKAVFVGVGVDDGVLKLWPAKNSLKGDY